LLEPAETCCRLVARQILIFGTVNRARIVLNGVAAKLGTKVEITLHIDAEIPDGADDATIRTVTENSRTLGFDQSSGFEP
jgi:hypothetical protein